MIQYQNEKLTHEIIASAIEVHKTLGPGLLESVYQSCLVCEFEDRGLNYKKELIAPIIYKNRKIESGFRIDFLVEDQVIVELKSIENFLPIHDAQLLTYLKALDKQVGLLINFNVITLKNGIRRFAYRAQDIKT